MGDECPSPGSSLRHTTFSVRLQRVGGFFSRLVPSPRGPRQAGQFSAEESEAKAKAQGTTQERSETSRFIAPKNAAGDRTGTRHKGEERRTANRRGRDDFT